jgi:sigma-B regulation protein RsbU (phosphoserine phosphatase)
MTRGSAKYPSARRALLSSEPLPTRALANPEIGFQQLRRLTEISRALTYTTSLDQVTRLTVERGAELLDADVGVLMMPDHQGLLHVRAAVGVDEDRIARFRAPLTDELTERLQGLLSVTGECLLAVPLIVGGTVTGIVAVGLREAASPSDEWLLSALADQAAVALENARVGGEVRVEMEEKLRASEGATDAKDRALSTLAHDIRTPLGAIDGYCSILEDEIHGPINDRQRETLGRVRMAGRHLLSLLDNVMEMARLTAGVVQVNAEPMRLVEVAREAVQLLIPASDAKLQTLQVKVISDAMVTADPSHVRQVLINLIGNAVKFTPPDGSISVTVDADDANWGLLKVTDSGPGIEAAEIKAVFDPYYRSSTAGRTAGVGLGLAISQALIKHMHGQIELISEPGAGSTFVVRLPLVAYPA